MPFPRLYRGLSRLARETRGQKKRTEEIFLPQSRMVDPAESFSNQELEELRIFGRLWRLIQETEANSRKSPESEYGVKS